MYNLWLVCGKRLERQDISKVRSHTVSLVSQFTADEFSSKLSEAKAVELDSSLVSLYLLQDSEASP